jgi:ABC-type phosphate transport system substrate-binding protein
VRGRLHRILVGVIAIGALAMPERATRAEPAAGELVVIVNAANPARPSAAMLEKIFLRKEMTWDNGERIIPLNASPESERRQRFDRVVLGMSPDEAARYWLDQRIRGGGTAPREVGDAVLTMKLIAKLSGTIGYVPSETQMSGVRVVARIRNDKVIPP